MAEWLGILAAVRKVAGSKPTRPRQEKFSLFIQHREWVLDYGCRRYKVMKEEDWAPPITCRSPRQDGALMLLLPLGFETPLHFIASH